jgi:transketolase
LEIDQRNGIFCTTGSLGHGFPISVGMALARKKLKKKGKIFVMVSDGECQEGTTWESSLIASKHKLDNFFLIIDYNKIQALTTLEEGLPLSSLKKKFQAFNFNTIEIKDGHNFNSINEGFKRVITKNRPTAVIVHTIKGKGIKKFENDPVWHARKIEGKDIEIGFESLN